MTDIIETTEQPLEWADLWAAMDAKPDHWQLTTADMFDSMLEILPPAAMGNNCFLVGEPKTHDGNGEPIHACFTKLGDIYQARYMTKKDFKTLASIRS